jgi:hypothetical protein
MFAQCGANFAAVHSAACKIYRKRNRVAAGLALLAIGGMASGCAVPIALKGQDPADPGAKVAPVGYRSTVAPYTSPRPTAPSSWREQNDSVAPPPKSGQ